LIGSADLAQLTAEISPYTYNGLFFPLKLPLPMSDLNPDLIHDSLGQSEPTNPNGITIGSAMFA